MTTVDETQMYEMELADFEMLCDRWLFEPESRDAIEKGFAEIGIIARAVRCGDSLMLDVLIPEHIYIAAPQEEEEIQ